MAKKRRGLGSLGVDALLTTPAPVNPPLASASGAQFAYVSCSSIRPNPHQPRLRMDEASLAPLADSIREQGVLQPLIVRPANSNGAYELIAGERRWRAAHLAGLKQVPVIVRQALSSQDAAVIALVENIQREDLSLIEEAAALEQLVVKFDLTHEEAAQAVGRSRSAVSNLLRLLKLGPEARALLENSKMEMGHARALLILPNDKQAEAARTVVDDQLSVRETERLAVLMNKRQSGGRRGGPKKSADIVALERDLQERLGAKVEIDHKRRGNGKLLIHYADLDSLDGILNRIR